MTLLQNILFVLSTVNKGIKTKIPRYSDAGLIFVFIILRIFDDRQI